MIDWFNSSIFVGCFPVPQVLDGNRRESLVSIELLYIHFIWYCHTASEIVIT